MNVVIISGGTTSVTITGVTDTAGNTYHLVKSATGSLGCLYIYVAFNISAYSGSNTITAAFSGSTKYNSIVAEYSGVSKVAVDQSAIAGPTTSSAPSSGSVTTTFATELLIGAFRVDAANQWSSAGSGWTVREQVGSNSGTLMDKVVTSTGTYSATATLSLSETWLAGILTIGQ
jgi:hypothetical protein